MTKARSNATANAAKGDLTVGNGTNLSGVLGVGSNGDTLVADSSTSTGLSYQANYAAGKNKIINGDFNVWQRGTSFTNPVAGQDNYVADRWYVRYNGTGATRTTTQETFTAGTAPVAGYEGTYFLRYARTVAGSGATIDRISQKVENVRTFAGQTITFSFWAKVDSGTPTITLRATQSFGSGGSADVNTDTTVTLSTTWTRYTATLAIPSISGKTIGTNSFFDISFRLTLNTIQTFDFWGVQVEAGSVATAFQTATGTIQGELAACQRYYWRLTPGVVSGYLLTAGNAYNATNLVPNTIFPQTMRIAPTSVDYSAIQSTDGVNVADVTTLTMYYPTTNSANFIGATTGATQYRNYALIAKTTSSYLGFSAEL